MAAKNIRVGDAQQVIKQHQILGVCVGNPVAHSIAGGLPVKTSTPVAARSNRATAWKGT